MRRIYLLKMACLAAIFTLFSCNEKRDNRPVITVSILPQQYFAEKIAGDKMEISCMVPAGSNPESYDPTPGQLVSLSRSKAYLAVGNLGFETAWLDKLKKNHPQLEIINTSAGIALIHSECDGNHDDPHHAHSGVDPHTWSSPKTARLMARNILDAIVKSDTAHRAFYQKNFSLLLHEIDQTDSLVSAVIAKAKNRTFLIYHPSLTYLARDYGLRQFSVELNGKEPTPQYLKSLIEIAKKEQARTIFVQKEFDTKNARILAEESGCTIKVINPIAYDWKNEMLNIAKALSDE